MKRPALLQRSRVPLVAGWCSHMWPTIPRTSPYGDPRLRELQRREATGAAHRRLDDAPARLPAIRIETQVLFGDPIEALTSLCDDRDDALPWWSAPAVARGWLLPGTGRSSARLAGAAGYPVVVVAPDAAEHFLAGQRPGDVARELQSVTSLPDRIAA